jgi:RNA polymerase sigma-70 factor (ECF subfamily)
MITCDEVPAADANGFAPHETDAALIARLRAHDLSALGQLFDRYYPQIYRTAYAIVRDSAAAEDIAQDCFLKLNHYADRIDTSLPLAPWLYRVTVNLTYTWITRRQKRRVSLEGLVDQLMSPAGSAPDQMAEQGEVQARVRQAVAELPLNQRVVVVLHYLNGLSLEEIAQIVKCPVGTVKSRLYYARETLRRRLGDWQQPYEVAHGYAGAG